MKKATFLTLGVVSLLSFNAAASQPCKESSTVDLQLNDNNIRMLEIAIGAGSLKLAGGEHTHGSLQVQMCASSPERLENMQASSSTRGSTAIVELDAGGRTNSFRPGLFRSANYGYFVVTGALPSAWGAAVTVGSGSADIENIASLNITLGSGKLSAESVSGHVNATVGSGNVKLADISYLEVGAVGSGKVIADDIHSSVTVGSIGSGSVELDEVGGNVTVSNIGSGSLTVSDVGGDVGIGSLGSGSINARNVSGDFSIRMKGSGSVRTRNVSGSLNIPN